MAPVAAGFLLESLVTIRPRPRCTMQARYREPHTAIITPATGLGRIGAIGGYTTW